MKGFLLLSCKFGFDIFPVVIDFGMIVIADSCLKLLRMTDEITGKRHALCGDATGPMEIGWWKAPRNAHARRTLEPVKGIGPIAMPVSILPREPSDEIPMDEIKAQKSTAEEAGPIAVDGRWLRRWRPAGSKRS